MNEWRRWNGQAGREEERSLLWEDDGRHHGIHKDSSHSFIPFSPPHPPQADRERRDRGPSQMGSLEGLVEGGGGGADTEESLM